MRSRCLKIDFQLDRYALQLVYKLQTWSRAIFSFVNLASLPRNLTERHNWHRDLQSFIRHENRAVATGRRRKLGRPIVSQKTRKGTPIISYRGSRFHRGAGRNGTTADNSSANGNKYPLRRSSCLRQARISSASSKILAAVSCRGRKLNERAWSAKVERRAGEKKATGRSVIREGTSSARENAKVKWEGSDGPVYPLFLSSLFEMALHHSVCPSYEIIQLSAFPKQEKCKSFELSTRVR